MSHVNPPGALAQRARERSPRPAPRRVAMPARRSADHCATPAVPKDAGTSNGQFAQAAGRSASRRRGCWPRRRAVRRVEGRRYGADQFALPIAAGSRLQWPLLREPCLVARPGRPRAPAARVAAELRSDLKDKLAGHAHCRAATMLCDGRAAAPCVVEMQDDAASAAIVVHWTAPGAGTLDAAALAALQRDDPDPDRRLARPTARKPRSYVYRPADRFERLSAR